MKVSIGNQTASFRPWKPTLGAVFTSVFAFDCETTRLDDAHPWLTPAFVLGGAYDGRQGYFVTREHLVAFLAAHAAVPMLMHHSVFDLAVLQLAVPTADVYKAVEEGLVWDTELFHKLNMLATAGHVANGKGQSTLEHCAKEYLGIDLPKDTVDSHGNPVRLSYGQWLGKPANEIEPVYLEYLAKDVMSTFFLGCELLRRINMSLGAAAAEWGYVSPEWMADRIRRWGPFTHHIQLRAAIVLSQVGANGLPVDLPRREQLVGQLEAVAAEQGEILRGFGYLPGPGSDKALQAIFRRMEQQHPDLEFPRTATEKFATSEEALLDLAGVEPFVDALLAYRAVIKLKKTFLDKMAKPVLHPSFGVLTMTGRTSSFGEINAQNLPRDDRVRSCFVPREGHVFIKADYKTVEMATLAQALVGQFGLTSYMAGAINAGQDLHRLVASQCVGVPPEQVSDDDRQRAKPINFGKPGGMGLATLKRYAKASYKVDLTDEEVQALSDSWFALFPEMELFLGGQDELGKHIAELFCLTPAAHFEHTGSRRFVGHRANQGRETEPNRILGSMCLKVLKVPEPHTLQDDPYPPEDVDFFWSRVNDRIDELPPEHRTAILSRRPSVALQRSVMRLVGRAGVFTYTGRLRALATYPAQHNTVFQGLAADGAKLALWRLWRAGYRIVNFIHDEVLIEVPADEDLTHHANEIRRHMIDGMKEVVPDILIDVDFAACRRWHKSAKAVYDGEGRLQVWEPTPLAVLLPA